MQQFRNNMTNALTAQTRTETGTSASQKMREAGLMPGVVYGAGKDTQAITLTAKEFEKVWRDAGESTIIDLKGLGEDKSVLIHDVAVEPIYGAPIHVDLLAVRTDQVVQVSVPLTFTGVAPAEKDLGGNFVKVMFELNIEALPKDLPHELEVDISPLVTFADQILVKNITLPTGVTPTVDAGEVVALVQEAVEIEEEPVVTEEGADLADIEVEKKGKEEGEGEESTEKSE